MLLYKIWHLLPHILYLRNHRIHFDSVSCYIDKNRIILTIFLLIITNRFTHFLCSFHKNTIWTTHISTHFFHFKFHSQYFNLKSFIYTFVFNRVTRQYTGTGFLTLKTARETFWNISRFIRIEWIRLDLFKINSLRKIQSNGYCLGNSHRHGYCLCCVIYFTYISIALANPTHVQDIGHSCRVRCSSVLADRTAAFLHRRSRLWKSKEDSWLFDVFGSEWHSLQWIFQVSWFFVNYFNSYFNIW